MTETRKAIIELIEPYMDKTLSEGCLIKSKTLSLYGDNPEIGEISIVRRFYNKGNVNVKNFKVMNEYTEELQSFDFEDLLNYEIIGHYDITALLNYFLPKYVIANYNDKEILINDTGIPEIRDLGGRILNRPLHLYTEQEEKNLLELLLKIK